MEYLGIIPARGGSKRVRRKNLTLVAGKPLVQHTFAEAKASQRLERVILSTDDEAIAQLGRTANIEVPFLRPAHLATDQATTMSVIKHLLTWLEDAENVRPTAIVLLQPTTPLRTAEHIDSAIVQFEREGVDNLVSVSKPLEHPHDMVYFNNQRMQFALERDESISTRSTYPDYYYLNGAIYIAKTDVLLNEGSFGGGESTGMYVMDATCSIDIDTPAELYIVDCLLKQRHCVHDE